MATVHNANFKNAYTLPEIGTDWLFGLKGMYIILSLKHSTPDTPMFWQSGDCGYTEHLVNCGVYTKSQIIGQIWYYNDGVNTVAIPLTATALRIIGLKVSVDFTSTDKFLNQEAITTNQL
jgi:hypothetical protein